MTNRVRSQIAVSAAVALALAGCQSAPDDNKLVAVEDNALGITHVAIDHGVVNGDRVLTVRGLDHNSDEIATATLRTGAVLYGADMPEAWAAGTELGIRVGAARISFVSPDREPHQLSEPASPFSTFIRLAAVSSAVDDEARISFTRNDEVAFDAQNCSGANFPTSHPNSAHCCQDGTDIWHNTSTGTLAWRSLGTACRTSSGNTGCTSDCFYGPCGAHPNTVPTPNTTSAAVFKPTGFPSQCGRDSNGSSSGGGLEAPEPYNGSQTLRSGVTATCASTGCNPSGQATNRLTVVNTGVGGAQGEAFTTTTGAYPDQIDTFTWGPTSDFADWPTGTIVTITAVVTSGSVALLSGGTCDVSGTNTVTCQLALKSDVTVAAGFSP